MVDLAETFGTDQVKPAPAGKRRAKPSHWTNPPVPKPQPVAPPQDRLDPTRYGDWERSGIAVDF